MRELESRRYGPAVEMEGRRLCQCRILRRRQGGRNAREEGRDEDDGLDGGGDCIDLRSRSRRSR